MHVPGNTQVAYATDGMKIDGTTVTWSGTVGDLNRLEIRFQQGFVGRTWTGFKAFLSRPVIRIGG